ncbi:exodeoxyribonuclease III [Enorma massiliensis]|uniref:exodeoxyribonuclease III n=1 Tax=Enorma massiliensis TaxID=1472761 RepID=UPI003AF1C29C
MSQITPVAAERAYKFASWNVNGLRAVLKKDPSFTQIAEELDADILAIQETKMQEGQAHIDLPGYLQVWSYAERKGYSGTAVFVREEALGAPLSVRHAEKLLPLAAESAASELVATAVTEGRVCALEFERFWFVDVYTPNAQNELARIDTRMAWDDAYRAFLQELERETGKPVVTCGDFNVAHEEIDLKNPKSNRGNAGFSDEERGKFTELLDAGFTDTFRLLHPDEEGAYSWWSYRFNARKNNAGWRIDYFLVSDAIADRVRDATIRSDIFGSDHCPVELVIEL